MDGIHYVYVTPVGDVIEDILSLHDWVQSHPKLGTENVLNYYFTYMDRCENSKCLAILSLLRAFERGV